MKKISFTLLCVFIVCCSKNNKLPENKEELTVNETHFAKITGNTKEMNISDIPKIDETEHTVGEPVTGTQRNAKLRFVSAKEGLRVRDKPDINSNVIGVLEYKKQFSFIEESKDSSTIDGITSYWYSLAIGDGYGWVFGGYLESSWYELELEEYKYNNPDYSIFAFDKNISETDRNLIIYNTQDLYDEVKNFMEYEHHPLEVFLGNWVQFRRIYNDDGKIHKDIFFTISFDGSHYRFTHNGPGIKTEGRLHYFSEDKTAIISDDKLRRYNIVGKIEKDSDGNSYFFIDNEGPYAYFIREVE